MCWLFPRFLSTGGQPNNVSGDINEKFFFLGKSLLSLKSENKEFLLDNLVKRIQNLANFNISKPIKSILSDLLLPFYKT